MENYKGKIIAIFLFILLSTEMTNAQNKKLTMNQADSLQKKINAGLKKRGEEEVSMFLKTGNASELWDNLNWNYKILRQNSKKIRNKLFQCYKPSKICDAPQYNRRVLAVLDLPQYMKDSLLHYKHTEREVKAALGDTVSQKEIINEYREFLTRDIKTDDELDERYYSRYLDISLLLYMRTPEAIKVFLEGLNSADCFEDTRVPHGFPANKISLFYYLLGSYSAYVDDDSPLLSYFYLRRFLYVKNEKDLGADYQNYLRQLEKYFYDSYRVKISIKAPYLILGEEYHIEH